jgi:hypothetical protein
VKALLRLYPRAWRARYGAEFAEILEEQPASLGLVIDVIAGAVDARLSPQPHTTLKANTTSRPTTKRGEMMTTESLMARCRAGGPNLSTRDGMFAGIGMLVASLIGATAYIWLSYRYHHVPAVDAVGYTTFPAIMLVYAQLAYLRSRPAATQAVLIAGGLGAMYAFMWIVCEIAVRI